MMAQGAGQVSLTDRYEIIEEIGRGGMGVVYKARQLDLDRIVAVKRILPEAGSFSTAARFSREKRTIAKLNHRNILTVFDAGEDEEGPWLSMEYIEGGRTLKHRVKEEGALPEEDVITIGKSLCNALQYAHDQRVIHRDVKPSNVLLTRDGTLKLADFGLAREGGGIGHTQPNVGMGTPNYAAPEQLEDAKNVDHRADIYGLGATLYHLSSGVLPPSPPPPVRMHPLPAGLREVLKKALEEKPANRFISMKEMRQALGALRERHSIPIQNVPSERESNERGVEALEEKTPFEKTAAPPIIKGFKFLREEKFSCGGETNAVKIYMHKTGLEFVLVPGGAFMMGSPDFEVGRKDNESPQHRVTVKPFLLCRTQCTQKAWDLIGGSDDRPQDVADLPIQCVTWKDSTAWCRKAGLRLPSEAEWEYACRAGTTTRFFFGDSDSQLGDYIWDDRVLRVIVELFRVAGKKPNALGLYDMHGNGSEWCQDTWHDNYRRAPTDGSAWESWFSSYRVVRGSNNNDPLFNRSACRSKHRSADNGMDRSFCGKYAFSATALVFRPACSLRE